MTSEGADARATRVGDTAVARELAELWPNLFGAGVFVPLRIGIDKTLAIEAQRQGSALTRTKIRLFLGWHVRRVRYLEALKKGGRRHGINGAAENARTITTENAAYAQEQLQALMKSHDSLSAGVPDGEEGMDWWNGLDRRERNRWMKAGGDTGIAADAWVAFKNALMALSDESGGA